MVVDEYTAPTVAASFKRVFAAGSRALRGELGPTSGTRSLLGNRPISSRRGLVVGLVLELVGTLVDVRSDDPRLPRQVLPWKPRCRVVPGVDAW